MLVFGLLIVSVILKLKDHSNCEDVGIMFFPDPNHARIRGNLSEIIIIDFQCFVTLMLDNLITPPNFDIDTYNDLENVSPASTAFWVSIFKFQGGIIS